MFNFLPSILRYVLIGLSASIVQALVDNGFDPADAEQFAQASIAFTSAALVIVWSWKKNKKTAAVIAEKDERIKKLESDPITWNEPKETKYND